MQLHEWRLLNKNRLREFKTIGPEELKHINYQTSAHRNSSVGFLMTRSAVNEAPQKIAAALGANRPQRQVAAKIRAAPTKPSACSNASTQSLREA